MNLASPIATLPVSRRRSVRQKVHSPAYASLNGDSNHQVLDLSEIVDISEDGMAIQTSYPFEKHRPVSLYLDLTATKASIHATGEVVWSRSGRVGIRFPQMPDDSLGPLKEWLLLNAMVAGVKHRAEQHPSAPAPSVKTDTGEVLVDWMRHELESAAPSDYTSILTGLTAVTREVASLGPDLNSALPLIADRAQSFTRATGAAIALTDGADMVCRASIGPDAPGLGLRLTIGSGFSGACVRSGGLLRCEDSEIDPLVDRESCRALGIRSMIAVPIRSDEAVIGLLEVFSPTPHAFSPNDDLVLKRLAKIAGTAVQRSHEPEVAPQQVIRQDTITVDPKPQQIAAPAVPPAAVASPRIAVARAPASVVDDEFPIETAADLPMPRLSRSRKLLLLAAAATVLVAMSWVISPADLARVASLKPAATPPATPVSTPSVPSVKPAGGSDTLQKVAEQGDPAAQFAIGAHYATGEGVPQNYAEAVRWFSLAAEQGHIVSQATLGAYYWAGQGVPQDLSKAYYWSVLARAGGDEASKYRVAVLASRMTHADVVAAQKQANDWLKQHHNLSQNTQP